MTDISEVRAKLAAAEKAVAYVNKKEQGGGVADALASLHAAIAAIADLIANPPKDDDEGDFPMSGGIEGPFDPNDRPWEH